MSNKQKSIIEFGGNLITFILHETKFDKNLSRWLTSSEPDKNCNSNKKYFDMWIFKEDNIRIAFGQSEVQKGIELFNNKLKSK